MCVLTNSAKLKYFERFMTIRTVFPLISFKFIALLYMLIFPGVRRVEIVFSSGWRIGLRDNLKM